MGLKNIFQSSSQEKGGSKRNSSRSSLSIFTQKESKRSSTLSFQRNNKIIQNERHSISFDESPSPIYHNTGSSESEDEKHSQFMSMSISKEKSNSNRQSNTPPYDTKTRSSLSSVTLFHTDLGNNTTTFLPPKSSSIHPESLSNELLSVQQRLDSNPENTKYHLDNVKDSLSNALSTSSHLEAKIKTIVSSSKAVIMSLEDKLKLTEQQHALLAQEHTELERNYKTLTVTHENMTQILTRHKLLYHNGSLHSSLEQLVIDLLTCQQQKSDLEEQYQRQQALEQDRQRIILEELQKHFEQEIKNREIQFNKEKETLIQQHFTEKEALRNEVVSRKEQESEIREHKEEEETNDTPDDVQKVADERVVLLDLSELKNLTNENEMLKERIKEIEQVSRESATSVMDANERLEQRIQQLEESASMLIQENIALNEEIDLQKAVVDENLLLKGKIETMQQETLDMQDMISRLQVRLSEEEPSKKRQEELMEMHTRAQLGLIEYLEGEDDVLSAMVKFKKQLEV